MAVLGWVLTLVGLLGGLAVQQDIGVGFDADGFASPLPAVCYAVAFLSCPLLWARDAPLMGVTRGMRISAAAAMLIAAPLYLGIV